uniref:Fibronectin type-II domain-containing protein n=1 Tax=Scleropages formosus TaxID=113540 RepID=A0A8C9UYA6_SCLFO
MFISTVQDISPDYCVFPFKYKDHWYYSCTSVDSKHKRLWCSLTTDFDKDHLWGYCLGNVNFCKCHCHPLNQYHGKCFTQVNVSICCIDLRSQSSEVSHLTCSQKSSCVFPFIAGGKTYNHCTTDYWFPGISWCSTTANYDGDKKWVYCPSSGKLGNDYCVFPFKYNGQLYHSCTSVNSKHERLWCSLTSDFDQDHLWGYCLGNLNYCEYKPSCIFPFTANGKTYEHCTTDYWFPGIPWCATTPDYNKDQKWVYCPSSGIELPQHRQNDSDKTQIIKSRVG